MHRCFMFQNGLSVGFSRRLYQLVGSRQGSSGRTNPVFQFRHLNINNIETSVSIGRARRCIYTSKRNIHARRHSTLNTQSDPSMYVHSVIGVGRSTTSTTNMYKTDVTYLRFQR